MNTIVIFICPKCGICYRATQKLADKLARGSFSCTVCKTEVYRWSGRYLYAGWGRYDPTSRLH